MKPYTTKSRSIEKSARRVKVFGILIAVLGIAAMAYPATTGNITAMVIGAFLLIEGLLRLAFAASSISWNTLALGVFSGLLMTTAGIWAMTNPDMGLDALTLLIAAYFVVDGITQVYYSFKLSPIGGGSFLQFSGLISIALGALIFSKFPESSSYLIGIYVGMKLLVDGLLLATAARKIEQFAKETGYNLEDFKYHFRNSLNRMIAEQKAREGEEARNTQTMVTPEMI